MNENLFEPPRPHCARHINTILKKPGPLRLDLHPPQQDPMIGRKVRAAIKELFKGRVLKLKSDPSSRYRSETRRLEVVRKGHSRIGTSMATSQRCENSTTNDSSIQRTGALRISLPRAKPNPAEIVGRNLARRREGLEDEIALENVDRMVFNLPAHVVAVFKDYLIYDDANEFLHRYYELRESRPRMDKIAEYYQLKGKLWPSYAILKQEARVMRKGRERKEKVLRLKQQQTSEYAQNSDGSIFFDGRFLDNLAKEDLSNSRSRLPSDSLAPSGSSSSTVTPACGKRIVELLDAIDQCSAAQSPALSPPAPRAQVRNVLNLYVSNPPAASRPAELVPARRTEPVQILHDSNALSAQMVKNVRERMCKPCIRGYVTQRQERHDRSGKMVLVAPSVRARAEVPIMRNGGMKRVQSLRATKIVQGGDRSYSGRRFQQPDMSVPTMRRQIPGMRRNPRDPCNSSGGNNSSSLGSRSRTYRTQSEASGPHLTSLKRDSTATRSLARFLVQSRRRTPGSTQQISMMMTTEGKRTMSGSRDVSVRELSQRRPRTRVKERVKKCMGVSSAGLRALLRAK